MRLRKFNNILSVFIAGLAIYLLFAPLWGAAMFWFKKRTDPHAGYVYQSSTAAPATNKELKPMPGDNRVVIPSIGLDEHINEGASPYTLSKGIWHMPDSADPSAVGNMVLLGHSITYHGPGILYNLNKVRDNDSVSIYWQRSEHVYRVAGISVVSPFDLSVVAPTEKPVLTIYTCTPTWNPTKRLVIRAELEKIP